MAKQKNQTSKKTIVKEKVDTSQRIVLAIAIVSAMIIFLDFAVLINYNMTRMLTAPDSSDGAYYVDVKSSKCEDIPTAGSINKPWCTIQYAVSADSPVAPGNTIYVKRGVYKESINVGKSGTATDRITLTNYKNDSVIIDGSDEITNWQLADENIYQTTYNSEPLAVFVDDNLLEKVWPFPDESIVNSISSYLEYNQWTYDSVQDKLYIKLNKSPQKFKIEVPAKAYGITVSNQKFWIIDGLSITKFKEYGVRTSGSGTCDQDYLIVRHNTIARNESAGILIGWCPGVVIENNNIVKNGLVWESGESRHQGVKTGERWTLYPGSNTIYQTIKGNDCNGGICNAGPEIMYFNNTEMTYNYEARDQEDPALLDENEWTTLGPNGEEFQELYFYPPNGEDPTGNQVKREVSIGMLNGQDLGGHGILINAPEGREGRFSIVNNVIANNNSKGISVCYSINYCLESVAGSIIYGNYVYNSGESGVDGGYSRGVTFAYNNVWQNGIRDLEANDLNGHGDKGLLGTSGWRIHNNVVQGSGLHEYGFGHELVRFFNNTFVKDMSPIDPIIGCGNYGGENSYVKPYASDDVAIKNNIFVINGDGNHVDQCGAMATIIGLDPITGSLTGNVDWNGNDYFTIEPIKTHTLGSMCLMPEQGSECIDDNFKEAYPNEHRTDGEFDSFAVDPLFVDQLNNNLQLSLASPLINQGVPLTFAVQSGNDNVVYLDDAGYFHDIDDYQNLPENEKVIINNQTCTIIAVDYIENRITCQNSINYNQNDKVYWYYQGSGPDLGAYEVGVSSQIPVGVLNN